MAYALKKDPGTVLCYRKVNFSVNQPREHEAVITNRHIRIVNSVENVVVKKRENLH